MKLAELLNERKAVKTEIKKLRERVQLAARIQEGDARPAESVDALKENLIRLYGRFSDLVIRINRANMTNHIEDKAIMEFIAERDEAAAIAGILHELAEAATPKPERFSRNEIRYVPAIDISGVRKIADAYALVAREIDNKIQAANWDTEVS